MNGTRTAEEKQMIQVAFRALNTRYRVLAPEAEARVIWQDFNPCRPVQVVAIVEWPAVVGMQEVTLEHAIYDGAAV